MIKGGKGLIGVKGRHNCECAVLANYVLNSTDTLTQMVHKTATPMQKFLLKFASSLQFTSPELTNDNHH
eukprot:2939880-Ditylum_brightwellii.AAC.1